MWIVPQLVFCAGIVLFETSRQMMSEWNNIMYRDAALTRREDPHQQERRHQLGSLLCGGGGGGAGSNATARKRKEADFLAALNNLISNFGIEGESTKSEPSANTTKNRHARRKEKRLQAREPGLLGEIKKTADRTTTKHKSIGEVMDALKMLIASTQTPPRPTSRSGDTRKDKRITIKSQPRRISSPISRAWSPPTKPRNQQRHHRRPRTPLLKLEKDHWNGLVVSEQELSHAIANAKDKACIVCGLVNSRVKEFDSLPNNISMALISVKPLGSDCVEIRAPARSKAGILKIAKRWMTSKGPNEIAWQKWGPKVTTAAIAKNPETTVVRVQIFKNYVSEKDWDSLKTKGSITDAFRNKIKHAVGEAFIDAFNPKVLGEGSETECISAMLRAKQSVANQTYAASGLAGVFIKPLDFCPAGAIKWMKQADGEKMFDFALRVHQQTEAAATCRGVAFSATGSLGLREDPRSQARHWRVTGLRYTSTHDQVLKILQDQGWKVEWCEQFGSGFRPTWVARAIPQSKDEVFSFLANCGDETLHIEIAPWLPRSRRANKARPLVDSKSTFRQPEGPDKQAAATKNEDFTRTTVGDEPTEQEAKRARTKEEQGEPTPATAPFSVEDLGLTTHPVEGDGNCLYHAVAKWFGIDPKGKFPKDTTLCGPSLFRSS